MLDKIRQIKYSRLKEEEIFFLETIEGIEPFKSNKFTQSIFWKKNNEVLIEEDFENGWLRINSELIWSVFEDKYGYNYSDIQSLVGDMMDRHTNLISFTHRLKIRKAYHRVGRYINLVALTQERRIVSHLHTVDKNTNLISFTPTEDIASLHQMVERHTNLNSLTPEAQSTILPIVVERHTNLITSSNDR